MILAIRPEPGCQASVTAGQAAGLAIERCPLFEIRPLEWALPPGQFDGLLLGSANALRHPGPLVDNLVDIPVYAVGEATGEAARQRGFAVVRTGHGGLQDLLDDMAGEPLRLLRLAGREHVPLTPPPRIAIETAVAYDSVGLALPGRVAAQLANGALVLLHSAAAARRFAAECDRLAVRRGEIRLAALGPRIAQAAGTGWAEVRSAAEPNEAALLALAREMCHDPSQG
ncbi:MAG TPA: uroporphyrinogen-III synthase [Croceibacterium sp.]|nr:uroporphyrinogen-III synthase [Croceibacterium sp.]